MSIQEYACITSFLKNGFDVNLYTYDKELRKPEGVTLQDANQILPSSRLGQYTQGGKSRSIAAFSDAFRYNLLKKTKGWWFDADMLCLSQQENFKNHLTNKPRSVVIGCEIEGTVSAGVLFIDDERLNDALLAELSIAGNQFEWGWIGPRLVGKVVKDLNYLDCLSPPDVFYPHNYAQFTRLYDPKYLDWCHEKSNNSLATHLWNEVRRAKCIPNNVLPPKGSFLHQKYLEHCPELSHTPTLPIDTFDALTDWANFKNDYSRLKSIELKIRSNKFISTIIKIRRNFKNKHAW